VNGLTRYLNILPDELKIKNGQLRQWSTPDGPVDMFVLAQLLQNFVEGNKPCHNIADFRSNCRFVKATRLLKKARLIRYTRRGERWSYIGPPIDG